MDTPAPARTGPRDHHQQDQHQQQDPHQQQDQHQQEQQEQQGPERGGAEPAVWWDLPTYPFQRRRYWLERTGHDTGVARFGQDPAGHPLLAAVLTAPEGDTVTLTGQLSLRDQPWLAEHTLSGTVVVPGTAFVELAVRAGDEVGCPTVEELTLQAPLVLTERETARVQVVVGAPDGENRRPLSVYARAEGAPEWTRHAEGLLAAATDAGGFADSGGDAPAETWPPSGAREVAAEELYTRLATQGFDYGPLFTGLRAAWQRDGDGPGDGPAEVYAEVALPEETSVDGFGIHPALLDAALHVGELFAADDTLTMPFAWRGLTLRATGATSLRVRLTAGDGGGYALRATDTAGAVVLEADSLLVRAVPLEELGATDRHRDLYTVEWVPVPATRAQGNDGWAVLGDLPLPGVARSRDLAALLDSGEPLPKVVLYEPPLPATDAEPLAATRRATGEALALLTDWLAEERCADARLVVVVRGTTLAGGAVTGLVRAAQAENPDRFVLAHLPEDDPAALTAESALPAALAADEPEFALRGGRAEAPRLAVATGASKELEPGEAVLVTGGTGGLGAAVARHLADRHGVRRLVLASRRGPQAPGAEALAAELTARGVETAVVACDLGDREAVARLLSDHPVTGVVHTAGVVDDGLVGAMDAERLETVLRPKADAAWHLHELAGDLSMFVLFSSAAGTLDGAGQSNYAAANGFLDALAARRRSLGLPASSLAWGLWAERAGMAGALSEADLERMGRAGLLALPTEDGLSLLDTAAGLDRPVVLPMRLDTAAVARAERPVPPMLRGLVRVPRRRTAVPRGPEAVEQPLADRLAAMRPEDRRPLLLDVVRTQVAAVLGHDGPRDIEPERGFTELGVDSLTALELRNGLAARAGIRLPATLVFDHPTPAAVADMLLEELVVRTEQTPLAAEFSAIEAALSRTRPGEEGFEAIVARLRDLSARWATAGAASGGGARTDNDDIEAATADELFDILDGELDLD
ncbi:SDR family NAD(P)-dependent oxidoreductase [Streptomyces sp. NPDC000678]|uniref:type I polyketide synthase n=1 Tax=Streptomyces sp. NPDC000678 TaxID=3154268 RepID=UPI0033334410